MMNKDDLFNLAPRTTGTVLINGEAIEIKALTLQARFNLGKETDPSRQFALACIDGCPSLNNATVNEVIQNLDAEAMQAIAEGVMRLSGMLSDQEEDAQKKSESKQS